MPTKRITVPELGNKTFDFPADATEEEMNAYINQKILEQQGPPEQTSPLSLWQRTKYGLTTGQKPADTMRWLQSQFPQSRIEQDQDGNFFVDGRPVDPSSFELADIADLSGEAIEFIPAGIAGGAAISTPGVGYVAAAPVAGMGQMAGRTARRQLASWAGVEPIEGLPELALDVGEAGAIGTASEILGGFGLSRLHNLIHPFSRKVKGEAQQAWEFIKSRGMQHRIHLTMDEATESKALDIVRNIIEGSMTTEKFQTWKAGRDTALNEMAQGIANQFSKELGPEDLGMAILEILNGEASNLRLARIPAEGLYDQIEKQFAPKTRQVLEEVPSAAGLLQPGGRQATRTVARTAREYELQIPTKPMKDFAEPLREIAEEINTTLGENAGDALLADVLAFSDTISFPAAREFRSRLIATSDTFTLINKRAPALGKIKQLTGILDETIATRLEATDAGAYELWRTAGSLYKQAEKTFNNKLVRSLILKGDPELGGALADPTTMVEQLIRPRTPTRTKRLRQTITGVGTQLGEGMSKEEAQQAQARNLGIWAKVRGWFVRSLLEKATNKSTGTLDARAFNGVLYGPQGYGEPTIQAVLGRKGAERLKEFSNLLNTIQERPAGGTGKMLIQLTQGGAVIQLLSTVFYRGLEASLTAPGIILLTPWALSKWFMSASASRTINRAIQEAGKTHAVRQEALAAVFRFAAEEARKEQLFNWREKTGEQFSPLAESPIPSLQLH